MTGNITPSISIGKRRDATDPPTHPAFRYPPAAPSRTGDSGGHEFSAISITARAIFLA
jgi:hypothetical protein